MGELGEKHAGATYTKAADRKTQAAARTGASALPTEALRIVNAQREKPRKEVVLLYVVSEQPNQNAAQHAIDAKRGATSNTCIPRCPLSSP